MASKKKLLQAAAGAAGAKPYLFVTNPASAYLAFYDISGGQPSFLSSFNSSNLTYASEMVYDTTRDYLYVLSRSGNLLTIDVSDTSSPSEVSAFSRSSITEASGLAYIDSSQSALQGYNNNVAALDISNPSSISQLSTVSVSSPGYGSEGTIRYDSGTYAWLIEDSVIRTLNVSNLNSISSAATKVDTTRLGGAPNPRRPMFLDDANDLLIYCVYDPVGISTWDISSPTSVSLIATSAISYPNSFDFSLVDRKSVSLNSGTMYIRTINANGSFTSNGSHSDSTRIDGNRGVIYNPNGYAYVLKRVSTTQNDIHTYDVSNPSSISFVGTHDIYDDLAVTQANVGCTRAFDLSST